MTVVIQEKGKDTSDTKTTEQNNSTDATTTNTDTKTSDATGTNTKTSGTTTDTTKNNEPIYKQLSEVGEKVDYYGGTISRTTEKQYQWLVPKSQANINNLVTATARSGTYANTFKQNIMQNTVSIDKTLVNETDKYWVYTFNVK